MRTQSLLAAAAAAALWACGTSGAQTAQSGSVRADAPVHTSHPYEVKGKVQSTGGVLGFAKSVTIARDGAPAVVLRVADGTHVTLNDKPAKLSDLREGDEVRAIFDFDQGTPVAIDVNAKK